MKADSKTLRILSIFFSVVVFVAVATGTFVATAAAAEFAGGSGTAEDPYLIKTKLHLHNVRNYLDAHYKMIADIIFTDADFAEGGMFYNGGNGWEPIIQKRGNYIESFSGSFDGNYHCIEGLCIYREFSADPNNGYAGLFGNVSGEIKNLEMRAAVISLETDKTLSIGCLTGSATNATISDCKIQGEILVKTAPAYESISMGGICGRMAWSNIVGCTSSVDISADGTYDRVGGICGQAQGAAISKSVNYGEIKGTYAAGGICGDMVDTSIFASGNFGNIHSNGFSGEMASGTYVDYVGEAGGIAAHSNASDTISDCFNNGNITSNTIAGGIVGYAGGIHIRNSYNAGTALSSITGGIIGWNTAAALENCFFMDCTTGAIGYGSQTDGATRCSLQQLRVRQTFIGFDFDDTWEFAEGNYYLYPTLRGTNSFIINNKGPFNVGSGTKDDPYCIASATQLHCVRDYPDAHFKLVRDIQFTDTDFMEGGMFYNGGQGWLPIGTDQDAPFTGIFDGGNHTIDGLYINITATPINSKIFAGLFGYGSGCTITNLHLKATRMHVDAEGTPVFAGGVIGYICDGSVTKCSNDGNITVKTEKYATVGGIAGSNDGAQIDQCYNAANISTSDCGSGACGGIAGDILRKARITNCLNTGNLTSGSNIGGIVGYSRLSEISVMHCYHIGVLSSSGLDGDSDTNVSDTYYLKIPVGIPEEVAGYASGIGLTGTEMMRAESFSGFDFTDVWTMEGNPEYPYPELKALPIQYQKELLGMSILTEPDKTTYFEKELLDVSGGTLLLRYAGNVRDVIHISHDMVSGFDSETAGELTIYVSHCGFEDSFPVTVIHNYTATIVSPGCTTQGYTTYSCACGDSYATAYQDPLGHDMDEWVIINKPSCTSAGTKRRECTRCYHMETAAVNASGHDLGDWIVVTEPSAYADGEERRSCNSCGYFESRRLPFQGKVLTVQTGELLNTDAVWIDGVKCEIALTGDTCRIALPEGNVTNMVSYCYNIDAPEDIHTQYPTGMRIWRIVKNQDGTYSAEHIPEFDNILQYSGSSIRITGTKGIRMITSIEKTKKYAMINSTLAGYKLAEYGTALCWAKDLEGGKPMRLGNDYVKSNYAYKRGVTDPVFAQNDTLIQYTNVLVGFTLDQCSDDIAMRPYMILEDLSGTQITIYGGIVYRSIGYIAYQNRNVFKPGNTAYDYVWEIIHHVYGDRFDTDFTVPPPG